MCFPIATKASLYHSQKNIAVIKGLHLVNSSYYDLPQDKINLILYLITRNSFLNTKL